MILSSFLILTLFGHFAVSHPVYSLLLLHHLVEHLDSYWYNPMLAFTPLYHKSCLSVQQTFSSSLPRSDIRHAPLLLRRQAARPIRAVHVTWSLFRAHPSSEEDCTNPSVSDRERPWSPMALLALWKQPWYCSLHWIYIYTVSSTEEKATPTLVAWCTTYHRCCRAIQWGDASSWTG